MTKVTWNTNKVNWYVILRRPPNIWVKYRGENLGKKIVEKLNKFSIHELSFLKILSARRSPELLSFEVKKANIKLSHHGMTF